MKCIKYTDGKITRVMDSIAESIVNKGKAIYIPKSIWKNKVRDIQVAKVVDATDVTVEVEKKPKKRREKKTKKEIKSEKNKQKKLEKES